MKRVLLSCLCLLSYLLASNVTFAHPLSPASVDIREQSDACYQIKFRRSRSFADQLQLDFPRDCQTRNLAQTRDTESLTDTFTLTCATRLDGRPVRVLGLADLSLGAIVSAHFRDGRATDVLLGPDRPSVLLPRATSRWAVMGEYLRLGCEHLLTGFDHVLFVCGLLWLLRGFRRVCVVLTAFTLGHSITLCLSTLGFVHISQQLIEIGIALSLVAVALELTRHTDHHSARLLPLSLVVASLGLLHGLGFAGALADAGLPRQALPSALFAFNLGVELGQLAVVSMLTPLLWLVRRAPLTQQRWLRMGVAYGIGSCAAFWCIERSVGLFS
jgi:hypothetical protein